MAAANVDAAATKRRKVCHNTQLLQTSSIPNDIIIQILSWVPAKALLLRLRWTCKYWFDLITRDTSFIKLHLHRSSSINPPNHSVLISSPLSPEDCHAQYYDSPSCMFFQSYIDSTTGVFSRRVKVPNIFQTYINFEILGSCHGLLFFLYDSTRFPTVRDTRLCIWNPCTKEYKMLPDPNTIVFPVSASITYGFGYDRSTDDYKVIRNVFALNGPMTGCIDVQVYTLGTNLWRSSIGSIPDNLILRNWGNAVYVNGALYWIDNLSTVLSLDIEKEMYEKISNQPECLQGLKKSVNLDKFEGSLCLILFAIHDAEMWVMKKDYSVNNNNNNECSWTKLLKFKQTSVDRLRKSNPLRLAKNGKITLFDRPKRFALYDPKKNRTMTINRTAKNEEYMLHWGERAEAIYIESLVSLNSGTYIVDEMTAEVIFE